MGRQISFFCTPLRRRLQKLPLRAVAER